jgi:hypothetical protein
MKLAIQISGEFRTLKHSLETLQTFVFSTFPTRDIDIFVHTWRNEDEEGHGAGLALFKPRSYFLEAYEDRYDLHKLPRAYSMFYSIKRANDARKEYEKLLDIQYDIVMRYRTDCIFHENVFQAILPVLKERKAFLWIPKSTRIEQCDGPVETGICDWFAIGTPQLMNIYCDTYTTFIEDGLPLMPETMLSFQLQMNGITEQTTLRRQPLDFSLLRPCVQTESKKSALT